MSYLPENSPSMNNNAIAKFGEVKFCILFCLVPRASVLHGTKECCMSVGFCTLLLGCFLFIPCKRLVDNKYSRHV